MKIMHKNQSPKNCKTMKYRCIDLQIEWQYISRKVSVFGVILVRIFPYSARIQENTDQKNFEYEHYAVKF